MPSRSAQALAATVLAAFGVMTLPAGAAPVQIGVRSGDLPGLVEKAQVGVYVGVERPYGYYGRGYRPYYGYGYGYGPYYPARPYRYYRYYEVPPPPPPPTVYYERSGGDPDALAKCASRFRSFNARTGTYITYDGEERLCPYLR